ncbi:MAG: hypothetical protein GXP14_05735 [Gammaproteobacteria bacterium]|nr:hypothetical protein [Gammaproteobacteria bacterium]
MPVADSCVLKVTAQQTKTQEGIFYFTRFSSTDRVGRALKILGICWLIAGVTVFIPLAHFVLVPGFFIAGPVMAIMRYKVDKAAEKVAVQCPECGQNVEIQMEAQDWPPLYTYCPECNTSVQLTE